MIDYINAKIVNIDTCILTQNKLLNFCIDMNPDTGELQNGKGQYHKVAEYNNLRFYIYQKGAIYLKGSLHKYWNGGEHNYNDFDTLAMLEVLKDIETKFHIKPENLELHQCEIGVNITPPYKTAKLLKYCFMHRKQVFKNNAVPKHGNYIQCEHSQYIIKIYDKAKQYRSKGIYKGANEILRFEVKYCKMQKLKEIGVYTMQNLINIDFTKCIQILVKEWQNVLFYDFTIHSDSKRIANYCNPLYWQNLNTSNYNKHKKILLELVKTNSQNLQKQIETIIQNKGNQLIKKGARIDRKNQQINKPILLQEGARIDTLYILSKRTPPRSKNTCIITGLNIEMQKQSFLLSVTGIRHYLQHDIQTYELLKIRFLSDYWKHADTETQIHEIYHNIRNEYTNLKNKQKKIYTENQKQLFT